MPPPTKRKTRTTILATARTMTARLATPTSSLGAIIPPLEAAWPWPDGNPNFGLRWWLMSPAFLRGLVYSASFVTEGECGSWERFSCSHLVRDGNAARLSQICQSAGA